jgi:hypothetical protein
MRTTVVPAQVTTVEDKIAGNFSLLQVMLLTAPIFGGSALFVVLPPFFTYALYKAILVGIAVAFCAVLAIRIKGKVLLSWLLILTRYYYRPRYYVYRKNDPYGREIVALIAPSITAAITDTLKKRTERAEAKPLSTTDLVAIEALVTDPNAHVHFKTNRKGELYVHLTETR